MIRKNYFKIRQKLAFVAGILKDTRGDQNSSTAGLAILAVVVVGLAVVWAKGYFPDFMSGIGEKINDLFNL